ncbi:class I adenylate-forming enzyme family protein [Oricola sp.]|uniref:class I adenylate-forming enzyme family protein n=1 Tax=Oricola sp. TaxID=1979950 RepID=UPI0025E920D2|nr:class I adenylate-forming enzyme family protein [Oricola sp.]MCI5077989.1 acyl--CoA ligase [Oricola sp.]
MSNFNLIDSIMGIAASAPDREAIATPSSSFTYAELVRSANRTARHLGRHGVVPGDRVAIALPKPDQALIVLLATWLVGATGMMVDFRARRQEKAALAQSFNVRAIVEPRASARDGEYLSVATGDSLLDTVMAESDDILFRPAEAHPAFIIRSSGTTGTPVGVVFNHETAMRLHWTYSQYYLGSGRGLMVHAVPLFYAGGIMRNISQILDGSPTYIMPPISSAEEIADEFLSRKARQTFVVPPQLFGLLELSSGRTEPMFPNLTALGGAGGTFPAETIVRAYRELSREVRISYGSSYCGIVSSLYGEDILQKPESVGRPNRHGLVRITDMEGNELPRGEPGLIGVRNPTIADGIIGERRELSDRLIDGWAIPGDLGVLDEEGFLTLTGRASDMIVRKGVNIFPREIESTLERLDAIMEAAAVGFRDEEQAERLALFVTVKPGVTLETLSGQVHASLVADKRPDVIHIVASLPRNDAGKVLKRVLVETLSPVES